MIVRCIWKDGFALQQMVDVDVESRSCAHIVHIDKEAKGRHQIREYRFDADDFDKACKRYEVLYDKYIHDDNKKIRRCRL